MKKRFSEDYEGDISKFIEAMCGKRGSAETEWVTGHVGTVNFRNQKELSEFLDSLGDEVTGFITAVPNQDPTISNPPPFIFSLRQCDRFLP